MDSQSDFASFLHNQYAEIFLDKYQKAARLCFTRKSRFYEGYDPLNHLDEVLLDFFGNLEKLHTNGLSNQYKNLKDFIISNNLIGLIIFGADISNPEKQYHDYTRTDKTVIKLTRMNICYVLLTEYMEDTNIVELCKQSQNFNIYFKDELKMKNKKNKI